MERFVESVSIDPRLIKKFEVTNELKEKISSLHSDNKLTESIIKEGKTAWEVPISKYDIENANGRVYSKKLWENVVGSQRDRWFGSPMLEDHPNGESDGDPGKICGVWLEARIGNDGYVYGTFIPSGRKGRDLEEHLKNGLRAGTSSSGFGELLNDNRTVDPESFTIERLSDWVLTPSQGTYFTYEETDNEAKNASDSRFGESANKQESVVKEKTIMSSIAKLEEKKFRRDMDAFLEAATSMEDPQARLVEFEEILSYLEEGAAPDLKERVVEKIEEEKAFIQKQLKEAADLRKELKVESLADIKTRIGENKKLVETSKKESTDWEAIATILQEKLDKLRADIQGRPTEAYVGYLKGKIKKQYGEKRDIVKQMEEAKKAAAARVVKKHELVEKMSAELGAAQQHISKREDKIEALQEQITRLQTRLGEATRELESSSKAFNEFKSQADAKPKLMGRPADAIARYTDFREFDEIKSYWADLAIRHGQDIHPYKERILSCKTLREAQALYLKVLPMLNESLEVEAARLPESVSISRKERKEMLTEAGVHLTDIDSVDRLPQGWV